MTIYFDKNSPGWSNNNEMNERFLNYQTEYIRERVKHLGYIYWNQVFESLGVEWDTRWDNHCIEDADFTVVIGWDDKNERWVIDIY